MCLDKDWLKVMCQLNQRRVQTTKLIYLSVGMREVRHQSNSDLRGNTALLVGETSDLKGNTVLPRCENTTNEDRIVLKSGDTEHILSPR